jgi:hypothetical protein
VCLAGLRRKRKLQERLASGQLWLCSFVGGLLVLGAVFVWIWTLYDHKRFMATQSATEHGNNHNTMDELSQVNAFWASRNPGPGES